MREVDKELLLAAKSGDKERVRLLLENGANVNARDRYGWTALMWAVFKGYKEIVKLLLENGADVNVRDFFGNTALKFASMKIGCEEIVELLKSYGAKK